MQRMVWLSCLLGMLLLLSAVHRHALATPGVDENKRLIYANFLLELQRNQISPKIRKYSDQLYDLLSITQLSTTYNTSDEMMFALDASWDKQNLLSTEMSTEQKAAINKALSALPLRGGYTRSENIANLRTERPNPSLMVFFSSHSDSMAQNLGRLKEWISKLKQNQFFAANILLVTSTSTHYSFEDLKNPVIDKDMSSYLQHTFKNYQHISQQQLAEEMLWFTFMGWHLVDTIYLEKPLHFSEQLEGALRQQRDFQGFSSVLLSSLQPYCEEAKAILHNALPRGFPFHHSCFDYNEQTPIAYSSMDVIADSLNALKHWIKTETKYHQKKNRH